MNGMLLSVAWKSARDKWRKEMPRKQKLSMMKLIVECKVGQIVQF